MVGPAVLYKSHPVAQLQLVAPNLMESVTLSELPLMKDLKVLST